jgi:hypothetical protein
MNGSPSWLQSLPVLGGYQKQEQTPGGYLGDGSKGLNLKSKNWF